MSQVQSSPANCCDPCESPVVENIPGQAGVNGANGANGAAGAPAYAFVTTASTQPAVNATVTLEVDNTDWIGDGMDVFLDWGGYYLVTAIPDSTHVTLKNRGYTANSPPTTVLPIGSLLTTAGEKGDTGAAGTGSGDMLSASNLAVGATGVANASTALNNLGGTTIGKALFMLTNPSAIGFLRADAGNTITHRLYSEVKSDLDLEIGTDLQAYDAVLDYLSTLTAAADRLPYFTGAASANITPLTSYARTILDDADAATVRATLEKILPRYGLLGSKSAVDMNSAATDNAITIEASRYRIDKIVLDNASISLTTATAGVFTAAGGAGTTVVADQTITALSATTKFLDLTLGGAVAADVLTDTTLYFRVGTAQGAAATANAWIFGYRLD